MISCQRGGGPGAAGQGKRWHYGTSWGLPCSAGSHWSAGTEQEPDSAGCSPGMTTVRTAGTGHAVAVVVVVASCTFVVVFSVVAAVPVSVAVLTVAAVVLTFVVVLNVVAEPVFVVDVVVAAADDVALSTVVVAADDGTSAAADTSAVAGLEGWNMAGVEAGWE